MAEQLDLVAPVVPPSTTSWRVVALHLDLEAAHLQVGLAADSGRRLEHVWRGSEALALMVALNKADLSAKSLQRRVLERLVADGVLAGTISGAPD